MSDVHEALSQLLSGDLPDERAREWRRRIADEPEVAAAWASLLRVNDALGAVVDSPAPAHLDDLVLAPPVEAASSLPAGRRGWAWAGWAIAAAAVLAVLWPRPVPELQLVDGSQWIDGRARVHAADAWVDVDGRALVRVEPRGGSLRVPPQEEPMNVTTHIAAAVAGAVVTVAVYEGTARIVAPDEQGVVVHAGETLSVGEPAAAEADRGPIRLGGPIRVRLPMDPDGGLSVDVSDPEVQIAALQGEIDRLRFERDLAHGQLAHTRGDPLAWPAKVDAVFEPEVFEQRVADALADTHMGEIIEIDCQEYPCIAYVDLDPALEGDAMRDAMSAMVEQVTGGEDASVMQLVMQAEDDEGRQSSVMSMSVMPEDDEAAGRRVKYRADAFLEDWAADDPDHP